MADRMELRDAREALRNVRETRQAPWEGFECREVPNGTGGTDVTFTGVACVTDTGYEMEDWLGSWTEQVTSGAFTNTLSQGADVAFLLNHEGMTLARTKPGTLKLAEDPTGLQVEAKMDASNMYVQALRSAVDRGDIDEMSFAFRVVRQEWDQDYENRWINEVNLDKGDVSAVNYGANPHTAGFPAMRSAAAAERTLRESRVPWATAAGALRSYRQHLLTRDGSTFSDEDMAALTQILNLIAAADGAVDVAQPLLAELIDVPNPDLPPEGPAVDPDDGSDDEDELAAAALPVARARLALLLTRA